MRDGVKDNSASDPRWWRRANVGGFGGSEWGGQNNHHSHNGRRRRVGSCPPYNPWFVQLACIIVFCRIKYGVAATTLGRLHCSSACQPLAFLHTKQQNNHQPRCSRPPQRVRCTIRPRSVCLSRYLSLARHTHTRSQHQRKNTRIKSANHAAFA